MTTASAAFEWFIDFIGSWMNNCVMRALPFLAWVLASAQLASAQQPIGQGPMGLACCPRGA
eukprot:365821-Chlamydomonas_euryale.AAC.6